MMNSAVVVRGGAHVTLRGLDVDGCRSACILTERGSRDITIEQNTGRHSAFDGLSLNDTSFARIVGNRFSDNHAAGITAEHLEDSILAGNNLSRNGSEGIYLSDSRRNRIEANTIGYNEFAGVFLTCAVIQHALPILCRVNTMSQDNVFAGNRFLHNRYAYFPEPNPAASCREANQVPNQSRNDAFIGNPNGDHGPHCIRYFQERPSG
jgi:parallel beta-helix repeat protein